MSVVYVRIPFCHSHTTTTLCLAHPLNGDCVVQILKAAEFSYDSARRQISLIALPSKYSNQDTTSTLHYIATYAVVAFCSKHTLNIHEDANAYTGMRTHAASHSIIRHPRWL